MTFGKARTYMTAMGRLIAAAVGVLSASECLTSALGAHDFWIEPVRFRTPPGIELPVRLRVGEQLVGDPVARDPAHVVRFAAVGAKGELAVEGNPGQEPAGSVVLVNPGTYWIVYNSTFSTVTLEAVKFEQYLRDVGLERILHMRKERNASAMPGREAYSRCAKSLVLCGGAGTNAQAAVVTHEAGLPLEIIPERDPNSLNQGEALSVRLIFRSQGVEGGLVRALSRDDPGQPITARTDKEGRASLALNHTGFWLIECVHMIKADDVPDVDWQSYWASMTFEIPAAPR